MVVARLPPYSLKRDDTCDLPAGTRGPEREPAPLSDVSADLLRRQLRDQRLDGPDAAASIGDSRFAQWWSLVEAYRAAGHRVDLLEPVDGLPDMVYAANGATVVDGQVLQARFANPQRTAEAALHTAWHRRNGILYGGGEVRLPEAVNEAEGDFAVLSQRILAGYGFRTTPAAHRELAALTGREVISLELVDPRFYHLDVALTVLDDTCDHIAYYPPAFSEDSQALLAELLPRRDHRHRRRRVRASG